MKIAILATFCLAALTACNSDSKKASTAPQQDPAHSDIVYATGWDELALSDGDDKLDSSGHFSVRRTDCGWPADGAVQLELWNALTEHLNWAVTAKPSVTDHEPCAQWPDTGSHGVTGNVELRKDGKAVRKIYFAHYDQICSGMDEAKRSEELLDLLRQLNVVMYGWGCGSGA